MMKVDDMQVLKETVITQREVYLSGSLEEVNAKSVEIIVRYAKQGFALQVNNKAEEVFTVKKVSPQIWRVILQFEKQKQTERDIV